MKFLIIFLVSVIVCDPSADPTPGYGMHEPYPMNSGLYPINQSTYEPTESQLLGIASLFKDGWPSDFGTTFGRINESNYLAHVCSQNSRISQIIANQTIVNSPVTCNGPRTFKLPFFYRVLITSKEVSLTIPDLYLRRYSLNGNAIEVGSGMINITDITNTMGMICQGDMYFRVTIYVADSQYQCASSGLTGRQAIYSLSIINGKCASYCYLQEGYLRYRDQYINILGAVPATTRSGTLTFMAN